MRWKRPLIALALAGVLLVGVIGVVWATNVLGWRAWRLQEVEGFIGASLPPGASAVHFATQNQKTRIIWLRFDLPPDSNLSAFLTQAGIQSALRPGFTPFHDLNPQEAGLTWWDAPSAADYAGLYDNTGQKIIEILLDNQRRVLYVRAYSIASKT